MAEESELKVFFLSCVYALGVGCRVLRAHSHV